MKSIIQLINETPINQWNYYNGAGFPAQNENPFTGDLRYVDFIENYFRKGGKIEIFRNCEIKVDDLRLPNHICSVFFLGILFYYNTSLHKNYKLGNNDPGYTTFPFIWFLIALFHDNAYQMENRNVLTDISSLDDLRQHFNVKHFLFDKKFSKCSDLIKARSNYFLYRKKEWEVVDHGILGGILLFDRLVKIRRKKKVINEDNLFWGRKLENQYKLAANAISLHNIWLPTPENRKLYEQYNLNDLLTFKPINIKEFPLFYLLGVVDTIEPLKTFKDDGFDDLYILHNLNLEFKNNSVTISNKPGSKLDFCKLMNKTKYFNGWLDIEIKTEEHCFELTFK